MPWNPSPFFRHVYSQSTFGTLQQKSVQQLDSLSIGSGEVAPHRGGSGEA